MLHGTCFVLIHNFFQPYRALSSHRKLRYCSVVLTTFLGSTNMLYQIIFEYYIRQIGGAAVYLQMIVSCWTENLFLL